ncbi:hypothetical protein C6Y14_12545 [Streptomyces dioscori]|uniref:Uncharacterized protein n=1 Tax=Streptomyces dioscori TaxID=2109333 RepID=A0A2P8Q9U8_9ACTN|nr:hypothetical protein [Streptomyces dioscori]PSM42998.1 hypothetical protein C6Y14_12545 [Streptomyces dioscori]
MADRQGSKYDPHPLTGDSQEGDGSPDPDAGKDLMYLMPSVTVAWDAPPSFNLPPKSDQPGGGASSEVADTGPLFMDAGSVRAAESTMLGLLRTATFEYEMLRMATAAVRTDDFFGPAERPQPVAAINSGTPGNSSGAAPLADGETDPEGTDAVAEMGRQFGETIKPAMEKALWQMANSLTLAGQYLAVVNRAGQMYAQVDRKATFPEPPSGSVTT